jgi:imidazolonepropionase-like amidohydrolase
MRRHTRSLLAMTLVCLLAGCGPGGEKKAEDKGEGQPAVSAGATYYFGARIVPGDGKPTIDDGVFIVENGKITSLGKEGEIKPPRDSGRVELTGYTITPVFINLHAHPGLSKGATFSPKNYSRESVMDDLNRYLYYGIGAVLSAGGDSGDVAFQIRDEQRQGKTSGARIYTAGRGIAPKGGGPAGVGDLLIHVSSPVEAKKAVEDEVARKVDFIKIVVDDYLGKAPKMNSEIYKIVVNEAHKNNLKVLAHVFYLADAKDLVNAGVDGLMHSIRDREVDDELISAMKAKNVFITPTLTGHEAKFVYAEKTGWLGEQLMREAYPAGLSAYLANQVTMNRFRRNPDTPALKQHYATAMRNLKKMADAGVKIGLGTDSGSADTFPGYFELREMRKMVEAGMTPAQVITAATSVAAEIIGADDLGALAVGKSADFLTFSNNPAEKIENLESMGQLYIKGAEIQRSSLLPNDEIDVPRITDADRRKDAEAEAEARRLEAESRLPHYGKFVLATSAASVRGVSVPIPRGGKFTTQAGPPARVSVSMRATGAELRQFYAEALPVYKWKNAGNCWERANPAGKLQSLCYETAANSATITITEK